MNRLSNQEHLNLMRHLRDSQDKALRESIVGYANDIIAETGCSRAEAMECSEERHMKDPAFRPIRH